MKFSLFATLVGVALFVYACEGENPMHYDANATSSLTIQMDNVVGDNKDLQLNTGEYKNSLGQSFKITTFKYFVSNIQLTNTNGSVYTVPQDASYFFVDESDEGSQFIHLKDIPEGEYNELKFTLGVDSLRNTKDVQYRTGVLDVTQRGYDMYWTWNSGYIFLKLEGTSTASTDPENEFQYHVGGFGGYKTPTSNNVREITLHLAARGTPKVKVGRTPNVHILVDVMKALEGEVQINFASSPRIAMPAAANTTIVKNYVHMFSHDHTEQ